jgi:hypothetical protein
LTGVVFPSPAAGATVGNCAAAIAAILIHEKHIASVIRAMFSLLRSSPAFGLFREAFDRFARSNLD